MILRFEKERDCTEVDYVKDPPHIIDKTSLEEEKVTTKIKNQKTKKNLLKPANYVKTTSKKKKCEEMRTENATPKRPYVVKQKKDHIHKEKKNKRINNCSHGF